MIQSLPPSPETSLAALLPTYPSHQQLSLHPQEPSTLLVQYPKHADLQPVQEWRLLSSQFFGCGLSASWRCVGNSHCSWKRRDEHTGRQEWNDWRLEV